ncbi:helix-turn-helix domain-containing protein [Clostridium beijerinckii]|uniref:Helix-turn-helix domain-containing protein n=1 Tax=Clostridium beijerinckii TaxID=1520 RepID=A0AAW3W5X5_CLOBE|nr:hypothetical protein [Clostridium beijerinckii]MBC2457159.1 hypothetical protein [Clostridium beijerinckii]MBC2474215.1 hypothetical protein [Clostridium beijerinckii]NOV58686.1 hypothetical protein [Clostridium beijerinckii]NOV71929.1 hypothetical protein [Clostridium beijerinckii]NOW32041.1 hypothetical protein [Clostridium beijerinckii]
MDLTNLRPLSAADKLQLLKSTGGLTMLANSLAQGHSLRQIADIIGVTTKTMYRWQATYPEIFAEIAPYKQAAYRIICAYDAHNTIKGYIHSAYRTPQDLWNSQYIRDYFGSWGINGDKYYPQCLESLKNRSTYHLSNYTLIAYSRVSADGKIIPVVPII